ncbi:MAG: hypothetical protein JJE47_18110, partial [Acidimicrobiia bacterium]|nr:hypothetical protein [Acidimicrobiia bacterium]
MITEKTGLPTDKAEEVVGMVIGFVKDKLPGPIASQLDGLLNGGAGTGEGGGLMDNVKRPGRPARRLKDRRSRETALATAGAVLLDLDTFPRRKSNLTTVSRRRFLLANRSIAWPGTVVWVLHMALAPAFVSVLLAAPAVDAKWQHNPTHFWLVAIVAFANLMLATRIGREAQARNDARLFLMSLSYSVSAAFFGVHALATPKLLAGGANLGFSLAMPAGLFVAAILAALSSLEWSESRSVSIVRSRTQLSIGVLAIAAAWLYLSVNDIAPLGVSLEESGLSDFFLPLEVVGVALFLVAAFRYYLVYRSRPSPVAMALVTSLVLLAEVVVLVGLARPWQLSWWTWHVVILVSYGYVAYASYVQFRREGRPGALFSSVALASTVEEIKSEFRSALEQLVSAIATTASSADAQLAARGLGEQFGLSTGQTDILEDAAA